MEAAHDSMLHLGRSRTLDALRASGLWWPRQTADVKEFVRRCPTCAFNKVGPKIGATHTPPNGNKPWQVASVDVVYLEETSSGNAEAVVFTDRLSRAIRAYAVPRTLDSKMFLNIVAFALIPDVGVPLMMISDRGSNLISKLCMAFYEEYSGTDPRLADAEMHTAVGTNELVQAAVAAYAAMPQEPGGCGSGRDEPRPGGTRFEGELGSDVEGLDADLYTWHSYRSGLATALHAAGVDDGMIMLICRWMSPESLHVYRRMGTAENERHTRRAMAANVDLIQSTNIPKVMGDQGYAELFRAYRTLTTPTEWAGPTHPTQCHARAHARAPTAPVPTAIAATPGRGANAAAAPATPPTPVAATPVQPANAAANRQAHAAPPQTQPQPPPPPRCTGDAGSTTGVGRLSHSFPRTLRRYKVYNDRPSTRRAPTVRSRAQWESRAARCQ